MCVLTGRLMLIAVLGGVKVQLNDISALPYGQNQFNIRICKTEAALLYSNIFRRGNVALASSTQNP